MHAFQFHKFPLLLQYSSVCSRQSTVHCTHIQITQSIILLLYVFFSSPSIERPATSCNGSTVIAVNCNWFSFFNHLSQFNQARADNARFPLISFFGFYLAFTFLLSIIFSSFFLHCKEHIVYNNSNLFIVMSNEHFVNHHSFFNLLRFN